MKLAHVEWLPVMLHRQNLHKDCLLDSGRPYQGQGSDAMPLVPHLIQHRNASRAPPDPTPQRLSCPT